MTLDELVALAQRASREVPSGGGAPDWALGCFKRRSITFFSGATDTSTQVYWLQTRGLTADLRLPGDRPAAGGLGMSGDPTIDTWLGLAIAEGGLARSSWNGQRMTWSDWTSFQLHDKWPEPGVLRRVGDCLIEQAPSGAYVEDWRFQPTGAGPLLGLRLTEERDLDRGEVLHRGGGLVVCGRHAAFVRGRPNPLPQGRALMDVVKAAANDRPLLRAAFAFEASYGTRAPDGSAFAIHASTDPRREGGPLLAMEGFSLDLPRRRVVQHAREDGRTLERLFTLDTAEADFPFHLETAVTPEARRWLEREADTLLAAATSPRTAPSSDE
jgi:hypothetical protein